MDLGGTNQTLAALNGVAGSRVLNNGVLSVGDDSTSLFSGEISGAGSLVKEGGGMLVLDGTNTFTGPTVIRAGTLRIEGGLNGPVTVQTGATLTGTGFIAGDLVNHGTVRLTDGAALAVGGTFTNYGLFDLITGAQTFPANFVNLGIVLDRSAARVTRGGEGWGRFSRHPERVCRARVPASAGRLDGGAVGRCGRVASRFGAVDHAERSGRGHGCGPLLPRADRPVMTYPAAS